MSLDVMLFKTQSTEIYNGNITHNLSKMAEKAGLYEALWRPEEIGIKKASQLIPILEEGLKLLKKKPKYFQKYNPKNGWGDYHGLVDFCERYLQACKDNLNAKVEVSR